MQLSRMLYDLTGSEKFHMAATKLEIPLEAAIMDFLLPVKSNRFPSRFIG